jgi:hypothetical protein
MYCKQCGERVLDDAKFCAKCGGLVDNQPVQQAQPANATAPVQEKKKSSAGLVIGLVVGIGLFIVLLGAGALLVFGLFVSSNTDDPYGYGNGNGNGNGNGYQYTDPTPIENDDIVVNFGNYEAAIPYGSQYDAYEEGIMYDYNGDHYEFAIAKQTYDVYRNNLEAIKNKTLEDPNLTVSSMEIKKFNNTEYIVMTGKYKYYDYVMLITRAKAISAYTTVFARYGTNVTVNDTVEIAEPVNNSLKVSRSMKDTFEYPGFNFLDNLTEDEETIIE